VTFDDRYAVWASRSRELFDEASKVIPGGAGSSARTAKFGWMPYPPFMAAGSGSRITDVDGHEYVDFLLGLGPMILGHRHPVVTSAVAAAISEYGTCLGLPYPLEIDAARKVVDAVPGVEMVRFTNSDSEAVGSAIRIPRVHRSLPGTGSRGTTTAGGTRSTEQPRGLRPPDPASRPLARAVGPGVPAEPGSPSNDLERRGSFAAVMAERGDEVAAVITEPCV
jgi:glutamate-1-semialdehyde 2,1-aminomutase